MNINSMVLTLSDKDLDLLEAAVKREKEYREKRKEEIKKSEDENERSAS